MSIAVLFPGQGSQEAGMGRDLAEADPEVMALWKKAEKISKFPLRDIYWDGDEAAMAATQHLQPALTVTNLALWSRLSSRITPMAAAGHSLGEYSALAAAGVLPLETVLELVSLRGKLMADSDPDQRGAMAALVKLGQDQVEELVETVRTETGKILVVANYNTPAQFVASGDRDAVAALQEKAREAKGRAIALPVSGAFHSPLMREASEELNKALGAVKKSQWNTARFPVYSNASPGPQTSPDALRDSLQRQMTSPVLWIETISSQWNHRARVFVECGPKGVLGKMVSPILDRHPAAASASVESPAWTVRSVGNREQLLGFQTG